MPSSSGSGPALDRFLVWLALTGTVLLLAGSVPNLAAGNRTAWATTAWAVLVVVACALWRRLTVPVVRGRGFLVVDRGLRDHAVGRQSIFAVEDAPRGLVLILETGERIPTLIDRTYTTVLRGRPR